MLLCMKDTIVHEKEGRYVHSTFILNSIPSIFHLWLDETKTVKNQFLRNWQKLTSTQSNWSYLS